LAIAEFEAQPCVKSKGRETKQQVDDICDTDVGPTALRTRRIRDRQILHDGDSHCY